MASASDTVTVEPTCTMDELFNILVAPAGGLMMLPSNDMDEVYNKLYISEE